MNADAIKKEGIYKMNIMKLPYTFWAAQTFDKVYLFHTIEHIPAEYHATLLVELRRILKVGGHLCISYPEFPKVIKNYLDNKNNDRDWWAKVVYGRGLNNWDRHKAAMDTTYFSILLQQVGLKVLSAKPEKREDYNTMLICTPSEPMPTYEELLGQDFPITKEN